MKNVITWIMKYNKAIVGFFTGGITLYLSLKAGGMTSEEWFQVLIAAFAGGGIVFAIPNLKVKKVQ